MVAGLQRADTFDNALWRFFYDLAPEMVGLAVTVIVIDELVERANERSYKRRIFQQMRSPVRDAAVEAVRIVGENGSWDELGDSAHFHNVNWKSAYLFGVNLSGAFLYGANLQGAELSYANLAEADLRTSNLVRTYLWEANLEGANLCRAKLVGADLIDNSIKSRTFHSQCTFPEATSFREGLSEV